IELDTKKSNPAQCNLFSSYHQASTSLGRADRRMNRMARWRCQRPRPKTCRRQSGKAAAPTSCSRTSALGRLRSQHNGLETVSTVAAKVFKNRHKRPARLKFIAALL